MRAACPEGYALGDEERAGALHPDLGGRGENDITIINGHIKSWGDSGINLTIGGLGNNTIIERVTTSLNGKTGMYASSNAAIRPCAAHSGGGSGRWRRMDAAGKRASRPLGPPPDAGGRRQRDSRENHPRQGTGARLQLKRHFFQARAGTCGGKRLFRARPTALSP